MIIILAFESRSEQTKFEYLYSKYKNLLFYKAMDILHDHMLAEDAVSEAYLRIYRNLNKIQDQDSPRSIAFMVTIVRNCALTILKKNSAEVAEEAVEENADPFDLEESVINSQSTKEIYELLGSLDEQLRNIFILKYAYDLPHSEIAAQLGLSENNVTVKLHRTKKKLQGLLSEME